MIALIVTYGLPDDTTSKFILLIGVMIIGMITYKIFTRDTFSKNFKYWFFGNFLALNMGLAIIFLICFLETHIFEKNINIKLPNDYFFFSKVILISLNIFLVTLFLKIIKQDLPLYCYISTGLFSIILGYPGMIILYNIFSYENFLKEFWMIAPLAIICSSFLGGGIVDIYLYFIKRKL